jgi:LuxR family transcriptional regulator, maltose regulon positive regulatory protein
MDDKDAERISLSVREMDILKHLSTGLSDQEIATELVLSLNTVKWYNRKIYAKLNVNNRTQAVIRSQQLHILD